MENNESCVDRYDIEAMIDMGYIDGPNRSGRDDDEDDDEE